MKFFEIIKICWIVVAVYWIVSSFGTKRTSERNNPAARALYLFPFVASFLLLFGAVKLRVEMLAVLRNALINLIGTIVCCLGVIETVWARTTLGRNWSSEPEFKERHQLIQTGPYRYTRHPIYTGILVMFLGTALVVGTLEAFLGFTLCFAAFWIKSRQEEKILSTHFPEYAEYRTRVKALIPFVF